MSTEISIRETRPSDEAALAALYAAAFPEEDLLPLVTELLAMRSGVISLAAERAESLMGHVCFTECKVGDALVALLGPLAVAPAYQRQGVGAALIAEGLKRSGSAGAASALVLGDPAYYSRFGFEPETGVNPPYPLPKAWAEAWRSLPLSPAEQVQVKGKLWVPEPWAKRSLWSE